MSEAAADEARARRWLGCNGEEYTTEEVALASLDAEEQLGVEVLPSDTAPEKDRYEVSSEGGHWAWHTSLTAAREEAASVSDGAVWIWCDLEPALPVAQLPSWVGS